MKTHLSLFHPGFPAMSDGSGNPPSRGTHRVALLPFVAAAAAGLAGSSANAQVSVQTTDRAAFTTLIGPASVETFGTANYFNISTFSLSAAGGGGVPAGLIQPGATYSTTAVDTGPYDFNIDSGGGFTGGFLDRLITNGTSPSAVPLTITFDNPVRGFGFDTNDNMYPAFNVVISYAGGTTQTLSSTVALGSTPSFYGYYSAASDILSASIYVNQANSIPFAVDNFTFPAVPEPSSLALLILAAPVLMLRRWRGV